MQTSRLKVAALFLAGVACATYSAQALARPHKARHVAAQATVSNGDERDQRYPWLEGNPADTAPRAASAARRRAKAQPVAAEAGSAFASGDLVSDARRYLGSNPTGRRSLWCGAFMDKVLRETGHAGGGNLASAYARYGTRISGPQVGAIAVMGRKGGGHVGVVSGIDASGNPIIISGNHNNTVAEAVYPRGRIVAYVMP